MKRMDEVFNFPLDLEENNNRAHLSDSEVYIATFDGAKRWDDTIALRQGRYATHAINHVDALADALDALFQSYKALADSGDAGNWSVEDLDEGKKAKAALAAYRGEK